MQGISWGTVLMLILAMIACFTPAYVHFSRQRRRMRGLLHRMEAMLAESMQRQQAQGAEERSELSQSIHAMNDSVLSVIGEVSRLQQQQLDSFGAQIRVMNRSGEERMERMRQSVEERLSAYDRQMTRISQTLDEKLLQNERRLTEMRQTLDTGMHRLQKENDGKLEQIRVTVDEKLNATLDKRLGESFRTVSERLEQVYRGLGEMQTLAEGVGDLKKVLTSVKTRGIWGEVQLGALLEQALAPSQYEQNVCVKPGSAERVEFAVRLPGRGEGETPLYLPIDAKFPAEDYQRYVDAVDAGDRPAADEAGKALEAAIRTEARRIESKYIAPPHTTDFAIMFLPVEGLYAEVLRRQGIVEQLQRRHRVVITGPTTLLALLNSLQMGFRTLAIEQRSSEVWELLGAVKAEFGKFSGMLSKTQQRLKQASDSIEAAARKTRSIERRLGDVQMLSQEGAQAVDLAGEAEQIALPSLVEMEGTEEDEPDDL